MYTQRVCRAAMCVEQPTEVTYSSLQHLLSKQTAKVSVVNIPLFNILMRRTKIRTQLVCIYFKCCTGLKYLGCSLVGKIFAIMGNIFQYLLVSNTSHEFALVFVMYDHAYFLQHFYKNYAHKPFTVSVLYRLRQRHSDWVNFRCGNTENAF